VERIEGRGKGFINRDLIRGEICRPIDYESVSACFGWRIRATGEQIRTGASPDGWVGNRRGSQQEKARNKDITKYINSYFVISCFLFFLCNRSKLPLTHTVSRIDIIQNRSQKVQSIFDHFQEQPF
jgi:hypothetical protein